MIKNFFRKENGSITLFVLIAMLFFLFVVFAMFMRSSNSNMAQTSEIDQIKEEYEESVNNINQIYNETLIENLSNLLKPGDFVNYTYDTVTDGYSLPAIYSGYTSDQSITQTMGLRWQILSINSDKTVTLISETTTNQEVYFRGALGYNNGTLLMNDICNKLYSNHSLKIEARTLNLDDIESQMNEAGISARDTFTNSSASQYGSTHTYTANYNYYPNLYAKENGSGINTTEIKSDGLSRSESGYNKPTTETFSVANQGLTATQTSYYFDNMPSSYFDNSEVYDLFFNTNTESCYWLGSRCANCYSNNMEFGFYSVRNSSLNEVFTYNSNSAVSTNTLYSFRPVVTLDITQIQPCTGEAADGTDETIKHMHQIKEYF